MKRVLTLATSGLFVASLAILPMAAFAQTATGPADAATTSESKPVVSAPAKVEGPEAKVVPGKEASKARVTHHNAAKPSGTKLSVTHPTTASGSTVPATGSGKTTHGAS